MKGDGKGNFQSVPFVKSGLFIEGDVKDMEYIKIGDKKVILVSKNNDYLQAVEILSE